MCEMLGTEPDPKELPIERSDLTFETQIIFNLYDKLPSRWEGFSGQYLGKDLNLLPILCKELEIEKYVKKYAWEIIPVIDNIVAKDIAKQLKQKSNKGVPSGE